MYKACIFDLDGTLTDTLESITYSVNETLKELKVQTITTEQCRMFIGDGARCLMERAIQVSGKKESEMLEEAMSIYKRIFQQNCTYHVRPYEGIKEMLAELKASGIKLAVVSNKPHEQTLQVVDAVLGKQFFERIQGQCEAVPRKPAPDGLRLTMERLGVKPEETIYIGDSDVDMMTGKAAGVFTVGVSWGFRDAELLRSTGADCIITHAEEIRGLLNKEQ